MTPGEFKFVCDLLEKATRAAYALGHEDGGERKPLNDGQFALTQGNKLVLKKEINKLSKTR